MRPSAPRQPAARARSCAARAARPPAIAHADDTVSLEQLVRIVDRVREREGAEPAGTRDQWRNVRAAAHVALAKRGSRLALYDLRESLGQGVETMPVELMTALSLIGDASCLEPIAAAH